MEVGEDVFTHLSVLGTCGLRRQISMIRVKDWWIGYKVSGTPSFRLARNWGGWGDAMKREIVETLMQETSRPPILGRTVEETL